MPPKLKSSGAASKPAVEKKPPTTKTSATPKSRTTTSKSAPKSESLQVLTLSRRGKQSPSSTKPVAKSVASPDSSTKKRPIESTVSSRPAKKAKLDVQLNIPRSQKLDVYVFGSGEYGELGLGGRVRNGKNPAEAERPRLNDLIGADSVGIVQIAVGGMHCVAISHDNKIYTWGVNDNGALGRDTNATVAASRGSSSGSDSDDDDATDLNPVESTPTAIPSHFFADGTKFAQVVASDSATFVLTTTGLVYGWGTFSGGDGVIGFSRDATIAADKDKVKKRKAIQRTPMLISKLKQIKLLAAGHNHIQALDHKGRVFIWGCGEQNQLGRRIVQRTRANALVPSQFGLQKSNISNISCGGYHSFAVEESGKVFSWGSNNFGQTGISVGAGEANAIIETPTVVTSLAPYKVTDIQGGTHHSIACTQDQSTLVWGRCDDSQTGIPLDKIPKTDLVFNVQNKPRILTKPTVVPGVSAISVAAGIDNCLAISATGKAYSWGFSANYRTGLRTEEPVKEPTILENSALLGKNLIYAGCGGQFSVLAGPASL